MDAINVRRGLAELRRRWERHAPADPMCLSEELEGGLSVSDFCVRFVLQQRTRRRA
tara:strand:+ start:6704 stop:6871 length:168 start_codon:yes stop_codon:yes gene_type:complete